MKIKIQVTAEDIENGTCGSEVACPIAIAARRALNVPNGKPLYVNSATMSLAGGVDYPLPQEAQEFIEWFDVEASAEPFEFEIEIE